MDSDANRRSGGHRQLDNLITPAYSYGLERITAYGMDGTGITGKTNYVYDGRGSVVQTVSAPVAGQKAKSALPETQVKVQSFAYTAFGEQMGRKIPGFGYNAEAYDSATGMINLRARQYEPTVNRFGQKDIVSGQIISPLSLNRYAYCSNSPVMHIDPSGQYALDSIGNWWNKAKQTTIGKVVDTVIVKPVTSVVKKITAVIRPVINVVTEVVKKAVQAYQAAQQEIASIDPSRPTCEIEKQLIWQRACSIAVGDEDTANEITKRLEKVQGYDKSDWLFLAGDCLMDDSIPLHDRFAMLDILKEKHDITAEDLIALGLYTEETRYHPFFFGIFREDVASNFAALLELSYRLTRQGTTVWEMSLEEQRMRSQQQFAMLYYLGLQAGLSGVQAYNAAGSAIRMDGATSAALGYESVPSDFLPFNYTGTRYEINVTNQAMYQLGNHFNSHGKPEMGYASKKEYQQAAYDFALEARKSPDAKIYIGTWNGRGTLNNTQQIIMQLDGKSVIINSSTGQIIDYYIGTDNLGFINIVEWR